MLSKKTTNENNIKYIAILDMIKNQAIQLFEERKVRTVWDDEHRSGISPC